MKPQFLLPDWPAPRQIRAAVTLRTGGASQAPFHSLNLGDHVGDDSAAVLENRRRLRQALALPDEPRWLSQVHGTVSVTAENAPYGCEADASVTHQRGVVCTVLTADCLPVLFSDVRGSRVGAAHAGWRGLVNGVLEATVAKLGNDVPLLAWLGPAIGPAAFEVGPEVREAFLRTDAGAAAAFSPSANGRWLADIYQLARRRLNALGVEVFGGGLCTFQDELRFFSYRRDGRTGRMASLIWIGSGTA